MLEVCRFIVCWWPPCWILRSVQWWCFLRGLMLLSRASIKRSWLSRWRGTAYVLRASLCPQLRRDWARQYSSQNVVSDLVAGCSLVNASLWRRLCTEILVHRKALVLFWCSICFFIFVSFFLYKSIVPHGKIEYRAGNRSSVFVWLPCALNCSVIVQHGDNDLRASRYSFVCVLSPKFSRRRTPTGLMEEESVAEQSRHPRTRRNHLICLYFVKLHLYLIEAVYTVLLCRNLARIFSSRLNAPCGVDFRMPLHECVLLSRVA